MTEARIDALPTHLKIEPALAGSSPWRSCRGISCVRKISRRPHYESARTPAAPAWPFVDRSLALIAGASGSLRVAVDEELAESRMSEDPRSYNTPVLKALIPDQIDNLGRAVIALTREICLLTDRLAVTEAVLAERGIDIADAVDKHQPDAALQSRIDAQVNRIIGDILTTLSAK
jgi:hypothetical protein